MSRENSLVTAQWVEDNLDTDGIVLIEVDEDTTAYDKGHIKGAIKLDWTTDLQDQVRRDFVSKEQFEVYENGEYVTTFDQRDGREVRYPEPPGPTIGERFGGRVAEVYGFKAYEAACAKVIEADPEGWDCSDVMPEPFLVVVRSVYGPMRPGQDIPLPTRHDR